ncbi:uncharacterized protein C19orf47 homolog isoform X2 [Ictalurus furcatus]|nr:uncharacterized protein C19orf47 homolog isoform X2 [Ictalurus furcatus]XP_053478655.1 uncharacterized protein C19orf47 homolog isoform X2 [Ictalurus furcatus]XP_053478656.1 uncharacterized protein C19orf47 homolog isoform X2 [Ictalurus furcatus]
MAATYAVSFVDNRIQKSMLMDLSKDIMMDLGITVIGDIIAILKHAKHVYRQDMCKMATEAISSGQTSVQAELRRTANTPATRMIANALSRDSPPSTPVRRPDNRLSVTISNKSSKMVASQPSAENGLLLKRRRVTSEMEGKYIISMPKGTTARSRRILAQQAKKAKSLKRTSVFERLGSESKADTSTANKQVTGVFSRLGKVDEDDDAERDTADGAIAGEDEDSDGEGSVLQYAGVLKRPQLPSKKEPVAQKPEPVALYRLGNKSKLPLSESTPSAVPSSTSSSQEGAPKRKILRRLGKVPTASPAPASSSSLRSSQSTETQDSQVTSSRSKTSFALASPKVSSSTGTGKDSHRAQMDAATVSVFKRLGAKIV